MNSEKGVTRLKRLEGGRGKTDHGCYKIWFTNESSYKEGEAVINIDSPLHPILTPNFLHAEGQSAAALCPSAWRKRITARTSQLAGTAMTVSMFYQYLLLHYAAKMYEGKRTARTEVPCYYWACALTLWQRVYFYQPIGGWFWNNPRIKS